MEDVSKGIKKIAKIIDKKPAKPLTYVKRAKEGPKGQPAGTYATEPAEVDAIVREAWGGYLRAIPKTPIDKRPCS